MTAAFLPASPLREQLSLHAHNHLSGHDFHSVPLLLQAFQRCVDVTRPGPAQPARLLKASYLHMNDGPWLPVPASAATQLASPAFHFLLSSRLFWTEFVPLLIPKTATRRFVLIDDSPPSD